MIVCICRRVSDHAIARAAREGCDSFEALQCELGVATGCGACAEHARGTLAACQARAAADTPCAGHRPHASPIVWAFQTATAGA